MSQYIGAIDQGTTSTRFMIFDHSGNVVAMHQLEHEQIFPRAGWVEHDADEIIRRTRQVIDATMKSLGAKADSLAAIGITNQRETTVAWNKKTGRPYGKAIVWQDTRTGDIVNRLSAEGGADRFREKCGLPISTYFSGTKMIWMLENWDGLRADAEKGDALFGTIDSWVIWNLTGGANGGRHVTDVTNASRTLLMNLQTLDWDDDILAALDIPKAALPEIVASGSAEDFGVIRADTAVDGVAITGVLGDQQAAVFGQTCYGVGEAKNTYGTGNFMLLNTGTEIVQSKNGLLTTVNYKIGDKPAVYALEGSIAVTGSLVQWIRDNLDMIDSAPDIEKLAQTVNDNGGIYFVPAFSGLFAPYWRGDARGVIVGLTRYVNKGHLARAVLEATAYQTREVADAMNSDSGVELTALKVDGGMVYNELLMQFQADILGVPVVRPVVSETTALGAAYAAGLSVGFWQNEDELRNNWQVSKRWSPQMSADEREALYYDWKRAVRRTFDWVENS
ncbi:MAG: glycerol kinase [Anaerolineaceae bacterium]|nr:MAG: glycerol kinase [Anaerolineaceae bacterium]